MRVTECSCANGASKSARSVSSSCVVARVVLPTVVARSASNTRK